MKELNNTNKLFRAADTMEGVLEQLDVQLGKTQHRAKLLKAARKAARKCIKSLNLAANDIEYANFAFRAVDDSDCANTPDVAATPDTNVDTSTSVGFDAHTETSSRSKYWNETLSFLFSDPDLQG